MQPEKQPLCDGDEEVGFTGYTVIQPDMPRSARYFCCGKTCGCCPPYMIAVVPIAVLFYLLGFCGLVLVAMIALLLFACCGCPGCVAYWYSRSWRWSVGWISDLYVKVTYLAYQARLFSRAPPTATPEHMPVKAIRPKENLDKCDLEYTLNIKVPKGNTEEFLSEPPSQVATFIKEILSSLPMTDRFDAFADGEDPVAFVMNQLGSVYPEVYQVWDDKQSDTALVRFCLHGLGAHRIETEVVDGNKMYVVRANALSSVPVRAGFERYGGDVYFDKAWRPVKIVDNGLAPISQDGTQAPVITKPGDPDWNRAKFRFRSSLAVLVALVDHLYGVHLQTANLFTTAIREQLSADHPIRRFFTPFTFQTIEVNDNARANLLNKKAMGPRSFGFTDLGMQLAFAAAPGLLKSGLDVDSLDGSPILDRIAYSDYLKEKKGIDTEYWRQSKDLCIIYKQFVEDYVQYYYDSHEAFVTDQELKACMRQFGYQMEAITPEELTKRSSFKHDNSVEEQYKVMIDAFTNFMYLVTAGHEQVGAVEVYVQDVSFCALKWVKGATIGTKQTAIAQALLMSFTSTTMPKLLGPDWTFLFPERAGAPPPGAKTPKQSFKDFQDALQAMSKKCDAYNDAAASRPFPENFPLYVLNPKVLETSVSV